MHLFSERQTFAPDGRYPTVNQARLVGKPMLLDSTKALTTLSQRANPSTEDGWDPTAHIDLILDCEIILSNGVNGSFQTPYWLITPNLDGEQATRSILVDAQQGCCLTLPCRKATLLPLIIQWGSGGGTADDPSFVFTATGSIGRALKSRNPLSCTTPFRQSLGNGVTSAMFQIPAYAKSVTIHQDVSATTSQILFRTFAPDNLTSVTQEAMATREIMLANGAPQFKLVNASAIPINWTAVFHLSI